MFLIRPEPDKRESLEAYILRLFYLNKIDFKNISKLIKRKIGFGYKYYSGRKDVLDLFFEFVGHKKIYSLYSMSDVVGCNDRGKNIEYVKFCPVCIIENPLIFNSCWHNRLLFTCTEHNCLLTHSCSNCGKKITWISFFYCKCEHCHMKLTGHKVTYVKHDVFSKELNFFFLRSKINRVVYTHPSNKDYIIASIESQIMQSSNYLLSDLMSLSSVYLDWLYILSPKLASIWKSGYCKNKNRMIAVLNFISRLMLDFCLQLKIILRFLKKTNYLFLSNLMYEKSISDNNVLACFLRWNLVKNSHFFKDFFIDGDFIEWLYGVKRVDYWDSICKLDLNSINSGMLYVIQGNDMAVMTWMLFI